MSDTMKSEGLSHIQIEICSNLYEKWREEKSWFHNIPRKGINTEIEYIDTSPDSGNSRPIVLCLHGAPGTHQDFAILRQRLKGYPIRILCPNFPNYSLTKTRNFGHYAEEKAEYILDFLRSIGIKRIDMIIGHSSSIYPSMIIIDSEYGETLKSLVFLNPCGHRRIQAMKYPILDKTSAYFYQYKFFRFFIKHLGKPVLILTKCPVKLENMDNLFLSVTTVNHSHYKRLSEKLENLGTKQNIAKMMIFAENDKLIQKEIFYEMAKMLGIEPDNIEVYDHNGLQQKAALEGGYPKGIALQDGGHYAFLSHSKIVNDAVAKMIEDTLLSEKDLSAVSSSSQSMDQYQINLEASLNDLSLKPGDCDDNAEDIDGQPIKLVKPKDESQNCKNEFQVISNIYPSLSQSS